MASNLQLVPKYDPHQVWPEPAPGPKPWEQPLSKHQAEAGFVSDPDPKKHVASGNTRLPPPVGKLKPRVLGVKDPSPRVNYTLLGVSFHRELYMPLKAPVGQKRPKFVRALNVVDLADNQVEALWEKAKTKWHRGYVQDGVNSDGEPRVKLLEGSADKFIVIEDYVPIEAAANLVDQLAEKDDLIQELRDQLAKALPSASEPR